MQPESEIIVKISKEDAGAISLTRVMQQRVTLCDLVKQVVAVTGKDAPRIAAVLERGSFVKSMSRLRWQGFTAGDALSQCLAALPDPLPERPFRIDEISDMELAGVRGALEIPVLAARHRRWFQRVCFLDGLREICMGNPPCYERYDYEAKTDNFVLELTPGTLKDIMSAADLLPGRGLRAAVKLCQARRMLFRLPRG